MTTATSNCQHYAEAALAAERAMVRFHQKNEQIKNAEIERLRAQNAEAAAFLDGLANVLDGSTHDRQAADCRAMAERLRE